MAAHDKDRRRILGRLRQVLVRRRTPRATLSWILALTALAGFSASFGLLKLGMSDMWLRYPLAALGAWGFFLLLVRSWAHSEQFEIRVQEDLSNLGPSDDVFDSDGGATRPAGKSEKWKDWIDVDSLFNLEGGCLVGIVVLIAVIAAGGMIAAFAGLIIQAEVLLAEVLLDLILVAALNRRLHHLQPEWWMKGAMRQTLWPVVTACAFLMAAGFLMQMYAPDAESIGAVWRHWQSTSR